jgi:hypothetical protein
MTASEQPVVLCEFLLNWGINSAVESLLAIQYVEMDIYIDNLFDRAGTFSSVAKCAIIIATIYGPLLSSS